jgi:hypothetical protein
VQEKRLLINIHRVTVPEVSTHPPYIIKVNEACSLLRFVYLEPWGYPSPA